MLYLRLLVACGAMLLSLLCFDGALSGTETTTAAEETASVGYTDTEVLFADVQEAVGEGMLTVQMGARSFDARVLDDSDFAVDTLAGEAPTSSVGCSAQAEFGPACDAAEDADEVEEAPYEIIRAEARRREEERLKQIAAEKEAEKRRIAAEKAAEKRRIAEEKAAREASLKAACPGYDAEFVATLTAEEQAEARYFYEQGYVFYRQNWSVLDDRPYGNEGFGQCGCGPTCIAAIISNLAGVPVDPEEMRVYGLSVGSWLSTGGTTYGFLTATAQKYGITATQIYAGDKESLFAALRDENKLVLATMGPGDFTLGAHFMLFRGITDEGKILIADSYSFEHSVREWDYDELYAQLKTGYWIFEKAE